jgi:hypothetical protein
LQPGGFYYDELNLYHRSFWALLLRSILIPSYGFRGVWCPGKTVQRYYFCFHQATFSEMLSQAGFTVLRMSIQTAPRFSENILTIAKL